MLYEIWIDGINRPIIATRIYEHAINAFNIIMNSVSDTVYLQFVPFPGVCND